MITQANPAGTARIDLRTKREQVIDAAVRKFPTLLRMIKEGNADLICFEGSLLKLIHAEFSRLMSAA